jgi:hypothetical protein
MAKVDSLFADFQREAIRTRGLVPIADSRPQFQGNLVIELAFLRGLGSWEVLLEETFLAYLLGKTSRTGRTYRSVMRSGVKEADARSALLGEKDFLDWLSRTAVSERTKRSYAFIARIPAALSKASWLSSSRRRSTSSRFSATSQDFHGILEFRRGRLSRLGPEGNV